MKVHIHRATVPVQFTVSGVSKVQVIEGRLAIYRLEGNKDVEFCSMANGYWAWYALKPDEWTSPNEAPDNEY